MAHVTNNQELFLMDLRRETADRKVKKEAATEIVTRALRAQGLSWEEVDLVLAHLPRKR